MGKGGNRFSACVLLQLKIFDHVYESGLIRPGLIVIQGDGKTGRNAADMTPPADKIAVTLTARRNVARDIVEFTFAPLSGDGLPGYAPGAHITVGTPAGASRRYSLIGPGDDNPGSYTIAVKREAQSRGGSISMHDDVQVGTNLQIEAPINDFALREAGKYLLIAGGIGVTPIHAMAQRLEADGLDFNIIYCARTREDAAYVDDMQAAFGARLNVHFDDGDPERVYDFWDHFAEPQMMHVYCCGPKPMMEEIKAVSGHWPEGRVHFEDFKPVDVVRADDVAFDVELARSGRTITIPADRTMLEALRDAGVTTVSSCESGTCGTCKCGLVSGDVDHRDMVLMDDEKDRFVMPCVSRSSGGRLVLDL